MTTPMTLILAAGGLRSLVATALATASGEGTRVMLLHLRDQRVAAPERLTFVRRMAQHFRVPLLEVEGLRAVAPLPVAQAGDIRPLQLPRTQLLLTGLAIALEYEASTLCWPVSCDGDFVSMAKAQQQLQWVQHLAEQEHTPLPLVQLPLLEWSDRQVLELGQRLKAPFHLSWSCQMHSLAPCRTCEGCRRRQAAFDALGLQDSWEGHAANP